MPPVSATRKEIQRLEKEMLDLLDKLFKDGNLTMERLQLGMTYQPWFSVASRLVQQLLPERYEEFVECYRYTKRKSLDVTNYGISDYLKGIVPQRYNPKLFDTEPAFDVDQVFLERVTRQLAILESVEPRLDSVVADVRGVLQAELFDDEVAVASELHRKGHYRAAGAVAGVVLERHLGRVAASRGIKLRKKAPTIADFNDPLREKGAYDVPTWRRVQHLADLRNLCVHEKGRDPTAEEVTILISGTAELIKTVVV